MKIYIAGPMTGKTDFNFPAFKRAAESWRALGHEVANPAEHDEAEYGPELFRGDGDIEAIRDKFDLKKALQWDLAQVMNCDMIVMLKGWEKSTGARLEHSVAVAFGKEIHYQ